MLRSKDRDLTINAAVEPLFPRAGYVARENRVGGNAEMEEENTSYRCVRKRI